MKYIQGTIGLPLILSIYKYRNIKWYVDAEFEVHKDMRSHTGGFMTMGTGGAYLHYSKQKLNSNSSTEADLVGLYDVLTQWSEPDTSQNSSDMRSMTMLSTNITRYPSN